jgi:hypothetical protein
MGYRLIIAVVLLAGCSSDDRRKLGDICANSDECASGRCDERLCKAASPAGRGAPCAHPLECRSEQCIDGRCAPGIRGDGAECTDDLQCQSGRCLQGSCAGKSPGVDAGIVPDAAGVDARIDAVSVADGGGDAEVVEVPARVVWVNPIGSIAGDEGYALAADAAGNLYLGGVFRSTVDFGGQSLTSAGLSADAFVASYTAAGTLRWCQRHGGTGYDLARGVAAGGAGNVVVTGDLDADATSDFFVANFAATDGAPRWSHRLGGTGNDSGAAVAADSDGNVYVAGEFWDTVDFGGGPWVGAGWYDGFVASYDRDGAHRWSRGLGGASYDYGKGLALDLNGNVYVTGSFNGTASLGGPWFTSAGRTDFFIASFGALDGAHRWSRAHGGTSNDEAQGLAADASGSLQLAGVFSGETDLGGGPVAGAGPLTAFTGRYATGDGAHLWGKPVPSSGETWASAAAIGPGGEIYLAGCYRGTISFGPEDLTSAGGLDIFVASLTADGRHRWTKSFGGVIDDAADAITVDAAGAVYVTGHFQSFASFETEQFVSAGGVDVFLLKIVENNGR